MEVLPALQNVLLEGFQPSKHAQEGIAQFISARQLTSRPVAISVWEGLSLLHTGVRGDRLSLTHCVCIAKIHFAIHRFRHRIR
jgi:hypothetical protein